MTVGSTAEHRGLCVGRSHWSCRHRVFAGGCLCVLRPGGKEHASQLPFVSCYQSPVILVSVGCQEIPILPLLIRL